MLLSGIIKDAAIAVRAWSAVPLEWRPLVVSSFFFFPYIISVFMLCQMPSPSRSDVECRVVRRAMQKKDRQDYLYEFWPGLVFANIAYFFTCAYRHYRDLYSMEIFMDGNEPPLPGMFTRSGLSVGVGVTIVMCSLGLFKSNYYGFMANIFVIIFGYILCAVGMIIYDHLQFQVSPMALMILTGIASFSAYIPYGSTLYERKIAYLLQLESVTSPLSAVFPIQLGGGVGSLGTLIVLLVKNFTNDSHWNHLQFFRYFSYLLSVVGTVSTMMMAVYFVRIKPRQFRKREQEYRDYVVDKVNSFYH